MAALEVIALDTSVPQLMAPQAGDTYTFPRAVEMPLNTANGVLYLNSSKVVTSGSALTFDGTNLGLGTASPAVYTANSRLLQIDGGANAAEFKLTNSTTGSAGTDGTLFQLNGSAFYLWNLENSFLSFGVNNAEQMLLDSTGLGIGTNNPGAKLDIVGASSDQIRVGSAATEHYRIGRNASDGLLDFYGSQTGFQGYRFGGIDGTWATLNSSGNLGLGVTPSAWSGVAGVFEIAGNAYIYSTTGVLSSGANAYFNGTNWIYKITQAATRYEQVNGQHQWGIAPSGTAGNAISFTQALTLSSNSPFLTGTNLESGSNSFAIGTTGAAILGFFTNNTERVRIKSTGQLRFVPLAADPAGAEAGDVYYNSGTNKLRLYDGSTWVDLN